MTRDEFDALIHRLETVALKHPRLYILRVALLVGLAYGYLALVLVASLAVALGVLAVVVMAPNVFTIKFGIILFIIAGGLFTAIARGLWVRLESPEGLRLTREEVPALFALLDHLCQAVNCRPFHDVLLIGAFNAAVTQVPRLGVFGWHRNYLLLGLPLLQGLGPEEFKAVLAHEFTHSSRGHGRFGNWVYRVRRSWQRIFEQMARQKSGGGAVLVNFLQWFWPRFNAHAFVLARANEYEADACSARLAGAINAASALLRLPVQGRLLEEEFWPGVFNRVSAEPEPPSDIFLTAAKYLRDGAPSDAVARWLRHAFLAETNNADTHPCLKDRLDALGQLPAGVREGVFPDALPPLSAPSAAETLLGARTEALARQLSQDWCKHVSPIWAPRHQQACVVASELARLEQSGPLPPNPETLWKKVQALIVLHGDAAALPVVDQLLELMPHHAGACFVRGRHLLALDDPRGVEFVEASLTGDPMLTESGLGLLYGHYTRTGQRERLRQLEDRASQFRQLVALAQQERSRLTAEESFSPSGLRPDQLVPLCEVFAREPDISAVAVVRRNLRYLPDPPSYAVCIKVRVAWWKPRSSSANQRLVERLVTQIQLPGHFIAFVAGKKLARLGQRAFAVPQATIYQREAKAK